MKISEYISGLTYDEMVRAWKSSKPGDPLFLDPLGQQFAEVMESKRREPLHWEDWLGHDAVYRYRGRKLKGRIGALTHTEVILSGKSDKIRVVSRENIVRVVL